MRLTWPTYPPKAESSVQIHSFTELLLGQDSENTGEVSALAALTFPLGQATDEQTR